jgi:hypothetical protein
MLQWLRFYKMLNEMPMSERPDDQTLEDDERLDRWYDAYVRKLQADAAKAGSIHGPTPEFGELPQFQG